MVGIVALGHAVYKVIANAGNGEDLFYNKAAGQKASHRGAKHRDDGDQGIAQGMLGNNGELGQALGAGGADVILAITSSRLERIRRAR